MKLKKFVYKYYFFILAAGIIAVSFISFVLNNVSLVPVSRIGKLGMEYSEEIADILDDIKNRFTIFESLTEQLNEGTEDGETMLRNISVVFGQLTRSYKEATEGYFYYAASSSPVSGHEVYRDGEKESHISMLMDAYVVNRTNRRLREGGHPFWITCYNAVTVKSNLAYVIPMYSKGEYAGFAGIVIKLDYLKTLMENEYGSASSHAGLFTEYLEVLSFKNHQPGTMLGEIADGAYGGLRSRMLEEKNGFTIVSIDNKNWVYSFTQIESGQYFVYARERASYLRNANLLIILCAMFAAFCMVLLQGVGKENISVFDRISAYVMKGYEEKLTPLARIGNKAAFSVHIAIIAQLLSYFVFNIAVGSPFYVTSVYGVLILLVAFYAGYRIRIGAVARNPMPYAIIMTVTPIILHLAYGGFDSGRTGETIIWMLAGIMICVFLSSARRSRVLFGMFVMLLFAGVLIEIHILANDEYAKVFYFITSTFFLGFAVYTSQQLYVSRSEQSYNELEDLNKQVVEAQAAMIHREKMVTLGRLVAGVAHEINTPIGAVKASAQTMSAGLEKTLNALLENGKTMHEDERALFLRVIALYAHSAEQMHSTLAVRRSRPVITQYIKSLNIQDEDIVLQRILRLEMCETDILKANEDIWLHPCAAKILELACEAAPFVSGISTILFATNRVSKIVFALKSYSHTDSSGGGKYDLTQSIDNVLVLYHNQIKAQVEVFKDYGTLPPMFANWDELSQVWTNLIQNALHAMNGYGSLFITVSDIGGGFCEIKIRDTGSGISDKDKDKVFEPFFTTKPLGEGTGLGLDTSRKIVLNHGGTISFTSVLGEGTEFVVRLPIVTEQAL